MQKRRIGKSDLEASVIGLGCMSLGQEHNQNARIIHAATDAGINFIDTADLYDQGLNEISVGKALSDRRGRVIIATKVGNQWRPDGSGWDWNPSKAYILEAVYASLRRLGTDYIDLYQLHGGTIEDPIAETIEAFEQLKQAGHIRHYGISSIRPNTIRAWSEQSQMVSVMTQYSLLDRRPEEQTLAALHSQEIGVIVRGAVAKGLLVQKAPSAYMGHQEDTIRRVQQLLAQYTSGTDLSSQLALQYALKHPAVNTIAAGASTVEQVMQNAQVGMLPPLDDEVYQALQDASPALQYEKHRS